MKISTIKQIIELTAINNVTELEIKSEGDYIRIVTNKNSSSKQRFEENTSEIQSSVDMPSSKDQIHNIPSTTKLVKKNDSSIYVRSSISGVIYLSPDPKQENFVYSGKKVVVGETLCLVESMKTFTRITASGEGIVTKCLVENGQHVEAKQILFVLEIV